MTLPRIPIGDQLALILRDLHAMRPKIKGDPEAICAALDRLRCGNGNDAALAELVEHVKASIRTGCAFREAVDVMEAFTLRLAWTAKASGSPS